MRVEKVAGEEGFTGGLYQNGCSNFHKDGVNYPQAGGKTDFFLGDIINLRQQRMWYGNSQLRVIRQADAVGL